MSTPEADPSSQTSGPKISLGAGSRTNLHFLGGLSSGLLSAVLLQPADLLKTRVQQHRSTSLARVVRTILGEPSPLRQLWRGTLPSALRTGVGSALYFTALNNLRQRVARREMREVGQVGDLPDATPVVLVGQLLEGKPPNDSELVLEPVKPLTSTSSSSSSSHLPRISHAANLLTGAVARASVGFVMMPVTVIKVRYESNLYAYRSLWGACTDIIRHDGLRGFFAGFGTTAVRDAPYAGLYVLFYEGSKKQLSRWAGAPPSSSSSSRDPSPSREPSITSSSSPPPSSTTSTSLRSSLSASINFTSGVVAAVLATSLTNPFDAIKTRLQLFPARYTNMLQAGRRMMREEGVRALFDGLVLRVARKALSSAITWTIYEEIVRRGVLSREGEL